MHKQPDHFSNLYGEGDYVAAVMVLPLLSDHVQALLPGALELSPQTATPTGTHPVFFMVGRHSDVHSHLFRWPIMTYDEFVLGVPCTQWRSTSHAYQGPLFFMPRLFLNALLPIALGYLYGFAKELARIQVVDGAYQINSLWGDQPLVANQLTLQGQPGPAADFPLLKTQMDWLNQPFVGHTFLGSYPCSNFDWNFEHARIQAIEAGLTITPTLMPGLSVNNFNFESLDQSPLGAFKIKTHWRLSPPRRCS